MVDFKQLINNDEKISITGLGYVGFPLMIELAKQYDVVGFDVNYQKVEQYKQGIDVTGEVGNEPTEQTRAMLTSDEDELKKCQFHIVAVPTPINIDKTPNLTPITQACKTIARNLTQGTIIVFESTVYPGTTEEICVPIIEKYSGLTYGKDFKIGYSPERINPGDKVKTLTNITKVVSGSDEQALNTISNVYNEIIEAGIHRAESIRVAESAKVIENAQRDINIAFMNELSMVFDKMGINTNQVLSAAKTKWNFLDFSPGLVGGHCIGVDPYYFTYKAEQLGYHSQIILSGRKINDEMGKYAATNTIKQMIHSGQSVKGANVAIFGVTFKENTSDVRNSKVIDIIHELQDYGVNVLAYDPIANEQDVLNEFNIQLANEAQLKDLNAIVLAVPHQYFEISMHSTDYFDKLFKSDAKVMIDLKGKLDKDQFEANHYYYWSF